MDFGIAAIHHGERVADLRPASDVAKVVRAVREDQRDPVGGCPPRQPERGPDRNRKMSRYDRIGAISSLPNPVNARRRATRNRDDDSSKIGRRESPGDRVRRFLPSYRAG